MRFVESVINRVRSRSQNANSAPGRVAQWFRPLVVHDPKKRMHKTSARFLLGTPYFSLPVGRCRCQLAKFLPSQPGREAARPRGREAARPRSEQVSRQPSVQHMSPPAISFHKPSAPSISLSLSHNIVHRVETNLIKYVPNGSQPHPVRPCVRASRSCSLFAGSTSPTDHVSDV